MYEVNANGNRSFSSRSAASVASVATAWHRQGHEPQAYVIGHRDGKVATERVEVGTAKETASRLVAASKR